VNFGNSSPTCPCTICACNDPRRRAARHAVALSGRTWYFWPVWPILGAGIGIGSGGHRVVVRRMLHCIAVAAGRVGAPT
jgi:hypothetical protein